MKIIKIELYKDYTYFIIGNKFFYLRPNGEFGQSLPFDKNEKRHLDRLKAHYDAKIIEL